MTAIEFYDRTPIENVISSLTTVPDKIIFIGDEKVMRKRMHIYREFLEKRGLSIELACRDINKYNLNDIVDTLSDIVETEDECTFDLTGGEDLVLVAMGIVFQKYSHKNIQMQRFSVSKGVITDCDNDGNLVYTGSPKVSVEENIMLYGGGIRYTDGYDSRTYQWDLSEEFINDIEAMWEICLKNPGIWNTQLNIIGAFEEFADEDDPLRVSVNMTDVKKFLSDNGMKYVSVYPLLKTLAQKNLINYYKDDGDEISFVYKDEQIKRCLIKAGTVLELKVLIVAKSIKDENGDDFYNDCVNGVYIDWDGELHNAGDEKKDTENEIDVVLMRGITPVFISCKNGGIKDEELYKLDAVSNRFGGPYVRKALIATYVGKKADSMKYFEQRAADMNIELIYSVHEMNDAQFVKKIRNLVNV